MTRSRNTIVMLLAIAIAVIFWVNIPNLVGFFIAATLKDMGATQVDIKVARVGWQQGYIQHLNFHKQLAQRNLQIDARQLSVQYTWMGLVNGRLENIILPDTTITISPANETSETDRRIGLPYFGLPDAAQLPANKVLVDKLNIIHQHENQQHDRVLMTGWLERQDERLRAALVFQQQGHQNLNVNLDMRAQIIQLDVGYEGSDTPWMTASVQQDLADDQPARLQLKSRVDLARFSKLLNAWGYAKAFTGVSGDLVLQMKLPANKAKSPEHTAEWEPMPSSMHARLQLSIEKWQGRGNKIVASLDWQATLKNGLLEWGLSKSSFLSAQADIQSIDNTQAVLREIIATQKNSRLHVGFPDGLSGRYSIKQASNFTINQSIQLLYQPEATSPLLKLTLNALSIQLQPEWRIQAGFKSQLNVSRTGIAAFKSIKAALAGHINLSPQNLDFFIDKKAAMTIEPVRQATFSLTPVTIKLTKRAECRFGISSKAIQCEQLAVKLGALTISREKEHVAADSIFMTLSNVKLADGQISFTADSIVNNLVAANQTYALKLGQLNSSVDKTVNKFRLKSELLTLNGDIKTQIAIDHYSATGKGLLEFELLPVDFSRIKKLPTRLLSRGQLPIKLLAGKLGSHGRIKWEPVRTTKNSEPDDWRIEKKLEITVDKVAGSYKKIGFIGLESDIVLAGADSLATTEPVRLQLSKLDAGLIMTDIQMNTELQFRVTGTPTFNVRSLQAKVLGGEINATNVRIDMERSHNPFVININGLDLSELLQWQEVKGISGTGLLDARLPFDLTNKGLVMREGQIQARMPGGRLRYIADQRVQDMAKSNSNIKMLLEALNNFIYSELRAESNYFTDGKLVLDVALKGKNPDFQQGKAINLNINIEENLLKLIKSLQLGEEISKKITDQLQQQK